MVVRFTLLKLWTRRWATVPKDGWGDVGAEDALRTVVKMQRKAGILCREDGKPFAGWTAKSPALQLSACQRDLSWWHMPWNSCRTDSGTELAFQLVSRPPYLLKEEDNPEEKREHRSPELRKQAEHFPCIRLHLMPFCTSV